MINQFGNVFEGEVNKDGKLDGFCVTYITRQKLIEIGWYKTNVINGNWVQLDATGKDLKVLESGWYQEGERVGEMKEDPKYKNFDFNDLFVDKSAIKDDDVPVEAYSDRIELLESIFHPENLLDEGRGN